MRVATKLALGYLLLIALLGSVVVYHVRVVQRSVSAVQEMTSVDSHILLGASSQTDAIGQAEIDARKYWITHRAGTPEGGYARNVEARLRAFEDTLRALRTLQVRGGVREAIGDLGTEWEAFRAHFQGPDQVEDFLATVDSVDLVSFLAGTDALRRRSRALRVTSQAAVSAEAREISAEAEEAVAAGWMGLLAALALSGLLAILIVRSITVPLHAVRAGARRLARGDFEVRVEEKGGPELADVARTFNEMAARLGELDRAKRGFLAKVSHDLKTPLASIQEVQRLLIDRVPGSLNEKQDRMLRLGLGSAERLSRLISDLLELARLEAGVEEYDSKPLDLGRLCEEAVTQFSTRTNGREIRLRRPDRPVWVRGDGHALRRVVDNLLENALTHGGEGDIDVWLEAEDSAADGDEPEAVRVHVRDRGPGIPPEERTRIFEDFYQGNGVRPGTAGLGLAICREIVGAHGGAIEATDAAGAGTVFTFSLTPANEPRDAT